MVPRKEQGHGTIGRSTRPSLAEGLGPVEVPPGRRGRPPAVRTRQPVRMARHADRSPDELERPWHGSHPGAGRGGGRDGSQYPDRHPEPGQQLEKPRLASRGFLVSLHSSYCNITNHPVKLQSSRGARGISFPLRAPLGLQVVSFSN